MIRNLYKTFKFALEKILTDNFTTLVYVYVVNKQI